MATRKKRRNRADGTMRPVSTDCWVVGNSVTVHHNGHPVRGEILRAPLGGEHWNDPSAPYWIIRVPHVGVAAVMNGQVVDIADKPKVKAVTIRESVRAMRRGHGPTGPMTTRTGFVR